MPGFRRAFFAYPAAPQDLRETIETAARGASNKKSSLQVDTWPALDILGQNIADGIRRKIDESDFVVVDITQANFNVYYEAGYAIGKGLPVLPVVNSAFAGATRKLQEDGFFDNIKYEPYQNSDQLQSIIEYYTGSSLLDVYAGDPNLDQPLFLLDSYAKTDFRNSIVSAVKSSKVFYRSFDPEETPRFSTVRIIADATSSLGCIVPFLAPHIDDAARHNLRASFLAGLFQGLGRPVLLTQHGEHPIPADFRESIRAVRSPTEVKEIVTTFAVESLRSVQHIRRTPAKARAATSAIRGIWLGSSAAENEFRTLNQYFLETSEFMQALKGIGKIIVGRKGSGKTAIFFMVRDELRRQRGSTVIDLKPESHELLKLRELLDEYASFGVVSHTIAGFWFVLILIEILITIMKDAKARLRTDAHALTVITDIEKELAKFSIPMDGDFTSRLSAFTRNLIQDVQREAKSSGGKVPANKLTNFVYGHEQKSLRELVERHSPKGGTITVLFDNLDKGWPPTGVRAEDVQSLRALIEALNRIQRELSNNDHELQFSVFLRNDVYELLVAQTTDRGKEAAVAIDWSDREKLRLVVGKRIAASTSSEHSVATQWGTHFPATVNGQDGLDYAIDHSLMRPRFLIDIIERSISFAINREHSRVSAMDLIDAVRQHSNYLVSDFGYEIRDSSQLPNEIIESFIDAEQVLSPAVVRERLGTILDNDADIDKAIWLLVWYGFFGVCGKQRKVKYIYDYEYSMKRMEAEIRRADGDLKYEINPAFYVGMS